MWFYYCGSEGFFFLFLVPLQIVVNTRKFILSNKCVPNNHAEILFLIRWKAYLCYIYRTFHFSHSRQTQISRWKPYGNMAKNTRIQKCFGGIKKFRWRTENRFRYISKKWFTRGELEIFRFHSAISIRYAGEWCRNKRQISTGTVRASFVFRWTHKHSKD